VSYQDIFRK